MIEWMDVDDPYRVNRDSPYRHRLIWFKGAGWDQAQLLSMRDLHPAFNVAGAKWRPAETRPVIEGTYRTLDTPETNP